LNPSTQQIVFPLLAQDAKQVIKFKVFDFPDSISTVCQPYDGLSKCGSRKVEVTDAQTGL
jgi:hypothetical protein